MSKTPADEEGKRIVFFKVNGQNRFVEVQDRSLAVEKIENRKAEPEDSKQIGAPLQGLLSKVFVKKGQKVAKNEPLFVIEAMKMETTITASESCEIQNISLNEGTLVNVEDLIIQLN